MASSEHPQTPPLSNEAPPTGIQTNPDSAATTQVSSVSLPPPPRPSVWNEAALLRLRAGLDAALVVVVLLFAFLAASFPAFNPDFFSELAVGRLVLQGGYPFGADPFVYTAEGAYVVHHSWLFAVLMYGLYQLPSIGGAVVVIFKALLIALLAGIMLRAGRRAGQSLWIPAACTALAILVASPRLYLQSTCLSFLFLGVTIWLLTSVRPDGRHFWWLPPLFALWVNCDSWFFLGPLTVALYLVGGLLSSQFSFSREPQASASALACGSRLNEKRRGLLTLGIVFVLGVAACLLNPHGVHAWTLPPEFGLTPAGGLLESDLQFHRLFVSPVNHDYYEPHFGWSVAGLSYWPLLLLSLASFAFVFNRAPWQRLLVWAGFALMSLYNVHAIPFFAIVAGPIMALNCQDLAARLATGETPLTARLRNGSLSGQALTVLAGLALSIAAVPGWLHSQPQFHRLGWSVRIDPSLQAMAETIRGWRESGRLPDQPHWFNLHPEVANYLAYFAPGERVFFDRQGMLNFREAAEDYLAVRQALKEGPSGQFSAEGELLSLKSTRQVLRKHGVRYWIFDNLSGDDANDFARLLLFSSPQEWILCHLDGRIAIFAWRDPKPSEQPPADSSQNLALDLKRSAFGSQAAAAPPSAAEPPPPLSWWQTCWDTWWRPTPRLSRDAETVALYDVRFRTEEQPRQNHLLSRAWQGGVAAAVISNSLPHGPMLNGLMPLSWSCTYRDLFPLGTGQPGRQAVASDQAAMLARHMYVNGQFVEPPSLYLAIRAARRALAADPEDTTTYLRLGKVYQLLLGLPQEGRIPGSPPQMTAIRLTQTIAAFQDFLRFQGESEDAAQAFAAAQVHEVLFQLYAPPRGFGYIDAAVHHLRQALNKRTQAGPQPGESATQHSKTLDGMSNQLTQFEGELDRRLKRYDLNASSNSGFERAKVALELGLIETALTEMLEQAEDAKVSNLSEWNIVKQVGEAALNLGRLDKARELLRDLDGKPAPPDRLDLYLRLATARGDYAEADRLLADALQPPTGQPSPARPAASVGLLLGRALLGEGQHVMGMPFMPWLTNDLADIIQRTWLVENASDFWLRRWRHAAILIGLSLSRQNAEWHLLRGWLALEAGRCAEARKQFEMARDLAVPLERWVREVDKLNAWLNPQMEVRMVQELGARHIVLLDLSVRYLRWLEEKPTP